MKKGKDLKISGKKKSTIKVNPRSEEIMERHTKLAVESIQSTLKNLRENTNPFDCIDIDDFSDEELLQIAEEVLSEVSDDRLEEICEAIESDLEVISERMDPKEIQRRRDQAKDRLQTGASMKKAAAKSAAGPSRSDRLKSALKSAASKVKAGVKAAGKKATQTAGKVAGEFSAAKQKQKEKSQSGSSNTTTSTPSSSSSSSSNSSSSGEGTSTSQSTGSEPRERKRDKIKRALKKGIGKLARAVSRGSRGVARRMGEEEFKGFGEFVTEGKKSCSKCGKKPSKDCDKCDGKGYVVTHDCSSKVEHAEWGVGQCITEQHTLDEEGNISHYDVQFEHGLEENVSVEVLTTLVSEMHEHAINDDKNQEVLDEKKSEEGFAGQATSYKGVVIKRTESGYEVPRFNITSNSVDSIKAQIDKEMAKSESYQPDSANNYNGPLYAPYTAVEEGKKKGLWANIHAKRKRGEAPAKKGDKDYPETLNVEGYGVGDVDQKLKTDRDGMRVPNTDAAAAKARLLAKAAAKRKAKNEEVVNERGDYWHPDPEKDKKLGGPGANARAREDRAAASKPKEDPKKLRKGESYMDYSKRMKTRKEELELDERTRYAKETGKDPQTGKPSEKGGTIKPGSAMSKVRKSLVGQGLMSSRKKAIQPQGKKKEKGAKGYQGQTPVDRIKGNLARKRAPKPDIGSRFD
ncbi:hypothetical protein LIS021110_173 [Cyanophage S-RIM14]|uniref:Uncharacterized protein n=1 Tax=Cyanophage S-RIM14 TaxID=1278423 RepID=A0A1D7SI54_9CAUD|nr:hypothetical protein LIS021110_173 [Cyanophage S-RIM14]